MKHAVILLIAAFSVSSHYRCLLPLSSSLLLYHIFPPSLLLSAYFSSYPPPPLTTAKSLPHTCSISSLSFTCLSCPSPISCHSFVFIREQHLSYSPSLCLSTLSPPPHTKPFIKPPITHIFSTPSSSSSCLLSTSVYLTACLFELLSGMK